VDIFAKSGTRKYLAFHTRKLIPLVEPPMARRRLVDCSLALAALAFHHYHSLQGQGLESIPVQDHLPVLHAAQLLTLVSVSGVVPPVVVELVARPSV